MKIRITYLLLTVFTLIANWLVAQPPPPPILFPMPTTTALWSENLGRKYAMDGDTIINNLDYKKIWTSTDAVFNINGASYYAAIREEPPGVVKAVLAGTITEVTLYNFKLLAGIQSTDIYLPGYGSVNIMITGYDSIQVETEMRPVYKVKTDQGFEYEWIGGIGCKNGFFTPAASFDPVEELFCFHENDTLVYLHNSIADCSTIGINEEAERSIRVYPNPARTHLRIVLDFMASNASLIISDAQGRVVSNYHFGSGNSFSLFDMKYASGLYFYHVLDDGQVKQSGKLIFQ